MFFADCFGIPEVFCGACSHLKLVKQIFNGAMPRPEELLLNCNEEVWARISEFIAKQYREKEEVLRIDSYPGVFPLRIKNIYADGGKGDWLFVIEAKNSGEAVRYGLASEKSYSPDSSVQSIVVFENGVWRKVVFSDEDNPVFRNIDPKLVKFSII